MKGFDRLVEARIQQAASSGALDHLPGSGKPMNLDDLAGLSHDERVEALLLRAAGGLPEEVELLRDLAALREALAKSEGAAERARITALIEQKALRLSVLFESSGRYVLANQALRFMP